MLQILARRGVSSNREPDSITEFAKRLGPKVRVDEDRTEIIPCWHESPASLPSQGKREASSDAD